MRIANRISMGRDRTVRSAWLGVLLFLLVGCGARARQDPVQSLGGTWRVSLDPGDVGLEEQWFAKTLATDKVVELPGSLAKAGLGHPYDPRSGHYVGGKRPWLGWPSAGYDDQTRVEDLGALVPSHLYIGRAWYERTVHLQKAAIGRPVRIELERVKGSSRLWVNGAEVTGEGQQSLFTPHVYEFALTAPGPHRFTLLLDNRPPQEIGLAGHGYGMETEPIWNGVAGSMTLRPLASVRTDGIRIHPARDRRSVGVSMKIVHHRALPLKGRITLRVTDAGGSTILGETTRDLVPDLQCNVPLNTTAEAWDEFQQPLYELSWTMVDAAGAESTGGRRIAFRTFETQGNRLLLNGAPVFLRGNLDCAIHPGSETPPTDRAWWRRVLRIHKRAGFNHIRFHTWCPPEVAFEVADELGLYLQVETSYWVDNWIHAVPPFPPRLGEDKAVDAWVLTESQRILDTYGHHPSFAFFCLGNEFGMGSDWKTIDGIVGELRKSTDTVLISGTTARKTVPQDQFWVTHATPGGATRGTGPAHTDWDFTKAIEKATVPILSHETGQRQSWPDYAKLLPAFGSVIRPYNLMRLKERAEQAGIHDHRARSRASVRLAHRLYKAEHEAMRRTQGLAGYQLLMLHDFTGQGEAHVGLLDPFYREKPGITLADIRAWNGPTVALARFPARTWSSDQSFTARFELAHQGPGKLEIEEPAWRLSDRSHDQTIASGKLAPITAPPGSLSPLGEITVPLNRVAAPAHLELTLSVGPHRNSWSLWVYPAAAHDTPADAPADAPIRIAHRLDTATLTALDAGEDVLLLFHKGIGPKLQQTRWRSTYWTGAWGWGEGLGLMCDATHPALEGFPNDGSSDWQWRRLASGGTCVTLDPGAAEDTVIVEHISTFHRPARQAFVLEARVGKGRLLACGFDLERGLDRRHAARAFRKSLLRYFRSKDFRPKRRLSTDEAVEMFTFIEPIGAIARASSEAKGFEAQKAIDGDTSTLWHTPWGANEPNHPHELTLEFPSLRDLVGIRLKGRADGNNGRLVDISVFVSDKRDDWGKALLPHARLADSADWQQLDFPRVKARFLRIVTHRETKGRPFASLAELRPILAPK